MFYARIFCTKVVFCQLFSSFKPKTQLRNFDAKILYKKCPRKTLMKLTPGVIFTNISWAPLVLEILNACLAQLHQSIAATVAVVHYNLNYGFIFQHKFLWHRMTPFLSCVISIVSIVHSVPVIRTPVNRTVRITGIRLTGNKYTKFVIRTPHCPDNEESR